MAEEIPLESNMVVVVEVHRHQWDVLVAFHADVVLVAIQIDST